MIIRHTPSQVTGCDVTLLCSSAGHFYNFMVEIKREIKIKMWDDKIKLLIPT